jgi:hypothetical protein
MIIISAIEQKNPGQNNFSVMFPPAYATLSVEASFYGGAKSNSSRQFPLRLRGSENGQFRQ